jgi:hypothetical protein
MFLKVWCTLPRLSCALVLGPPFSHPVEPCVSTTTAQGEPLWGSPEAGCIILLPLKPPLGRLALVRAMLHTSPRREENLVDLRQLYRWRPTRRQLQWAASIATVLLFLIIVMCGYYWELPWTGLSRPKGSPNTQRIKTLWDWLDLLIVPFVLALAGYLFNSSQNQATQEATQERAQDGALEAYLDKMSELLLDKQLHKKSNDYDETRVTARAQTLAVLKRLDVQRKGTVLLFLREARLINRTYAVGR